MIGLLRHSHVFFRLSISAIILLGTVLIQASPVYANDPVVVINTTKGPIFIRVFMSVVPYTASNFLDLVQRGFYSGAPFHRVENWLIQGGDPTGTGRGNFVDPQTGQVRHIRLETTRRLRHSGPGVVAMARTNNPNSASCQFYITKAGAPWCDGQYAVFGGVVDGMNTVMAIRPGDRILSAEIVDSGQAAAAPPPPQNPYPSSRSGGQPSTGQSGSSADSGF